LSDAKTAMRPKVRPLSPHLSVYRFRPTMAMSILHRITGSALYVGTLFVVWWLVAAASGPDAFSHASSFFNSFIGRFILFGYSWTLLHHMLGGIRHLVWDSGHGLSKESSTTFALATLAGSLGLTVVLWLLVIVL
jgi:succinate dehydrogenase / fumarate reductase cytochrome b subunit